MTEPAEEALLISVVGLDEQPGRQGIAQALVAGLLRDETGSSPAAGGSGSAVAADGIARIAETDSAVRTASRRRKRSLGLLCGWGCH